MKKLFTIIIPLNILLSSCDTSDITTTKTLQDTDKIYTQITNQNNDGIGIAYIAKSQNSILDLDEEIALDKQLGIDRDNANK